MKKLAFMLGVALLAGCVSTDDGAASYENPLFQEKFDKFSGANEAMWAKLYENNRRGIGEKFDVAFSAQQKVGTEGGTGVIILAKGVRGLKYTRCRSITWLVDGEKITPTHVGYESEVERTPSVHFVESVLSTFNKEDFEKIVKARNVEYQVCNDEAALTAEEQQGLQKVHSSVFGKNIKS